MTLKIFQVDAFTDKLFGGNPAAVIPLDNWLDTELMQQIALENNLSETVFIVPAEGNPSSFGVPSKERTQFREGADYEIRWFTPEIEIDLCGHATLASAYVLFNMLNFNKPEILFSSQSGILKVTKEDDLICMDFPSWKPERLDIYPDELSAILDYEEFVGVYKYRDILVEMENEEAVKNCNPDFSLMKKHIDKMIITAPATKRSLDSTKEVDFVSRFFAPGAGIDEDPVTGSAHSQLIPFWAEKLGKDKMHALQLSKRGGEIWCELKDDRVIMKGKAVFYMQGEITI
jgi:PhzF family phenazine biosynthesis protein